MQRTGVWPPSSCRPCRLRASRLQQRLRSKNSWRAHPKTATSPPARQAADGSLRVAIVGAAWMRAFQSASARCGVRWQRLLLESDLAQAPAGGWCWCAESLTRAGFVRTDDGSSIAVGPSRAEGLPEEITLALAGSGRRPRVVRVDVAGVGTSPPRARESANRRRILRRHAVALVRRRSKRVSPPRSICRSAISTPPSRRRALTFSARFGRRCGSPASRSRSTSLPASANGSRCDGNFTRSTPTCPLWRKSRCRIRRPAPAASRPRRAIARRDGELRHRAGMAAATDLLPLLARAAPAMSALPGGTVRSLHYADAHVVFELQKLDRRRSRCCSASCSARGLVAIAVPIATGARLRIGLD